MNVEHFSRYSSVNGGGREDIVVVCDSAFVMKIEWGEREEGAKSDIARR